MKKVVTILGKRNTDALGKAEKKTRKVAEDWKHADKLLDKKHQINMLNKIYLDQSFDGCKSILSELNRKHKGYRTQDIDKKLLDKDNFITMDQLKEKLVLSKLTCYYCKCNMLLMYDKPREETQWTLDRIDNDKGHNNDNVVIACLKCNLKRRRTDSDKFKFTKQMKIIKKF
tara:strand:- start:148 stop:663 length:516 start_codon:yes stop_codon:yes gene_type:complete